MPNPDFQRLVDWCNAPSDVPRLRRGVSGIVTHYEFGEGGTLLGHWVGTLKYSAHQVHAVRGNLHGVLDAATGSHNRAALEINISIADDRAWAAMSTPAFPATWSEDVLIEVDGVDRDSGWVYAHLGVDNKTGAGAFLGPSYSYGG